MLVISAISKKRNAISKKGKYTALISPHTKLKIEGNGF